MKILKNIGRAILIISIVSTQLSFTSIASELSEDFKTYKSSENFAVANADGTWDSVWSARKFDGSEYIMLENSGSKDGRGDGGSGKADVYYGLNINNSPNINGWWITPGINRTDWTADSSCAAVKTFKAPVGGYVEISFEEGFYSTASTPSARIMHTSNGVTNQIWPATGYFTVQKNSTEIPESVNIILIENDEINFEISIPEGTSGAYYTKVFWDPIVKYTQEPTTPDTPDVPDIPEEPDVPEEPDTPDEPQNPDDSENVRDVYSYLSSELYTVSKGDGTWDAGVWSAQLYAPDTGTYTNMTNSMEKSKADKDNTSSAYAYYGADLWNSPYVGAYWMAPSVKLYPKDSKHSAVKTFIAPKTGMVTVGFDSYFYATDGMKSGARIMLETDESNTKIWPATDNYYSLTQTKTSTPAPVELNIKKGDKLHFEISRNQEKMDYADAYYSKIYWDPIITYQTVYPDLDECTPSNNSVGVPANSDLVLKYSGELVNVDKENVTVYEIGRDGKEGLSKDTVCENVVMEENNHVIRISYNKLKPSTKYVVKINGIRLKNAREDSEKEEKITFTTQALVDFGEITTDTGALSTGDNGIYVDIVNNKSEPVSATLAVFVCKGTLEKYIVERAVIKSAKNITDSATISVNVNIADKNDYFIKATLTEGLISARSYIPLKILRGGN